MLYGSVIWETTSVSGVGDQTCDFYIAVYGAENMTSEVGGKSPHSNTGSRTTTATVGMCRKLTVATYHMAASSGKLLPFPASATKRVIFLSLSIAPNI